ncbi:MAG: DinB family protein [Vicinamibacteria bacterium]|jgi:uncharacterized damage-inducible protein DinB|nr:DinB family protein [Vicinamibacteria bacterium]
MTRRINLACLLVLVLGATLALAQAPTTPAAPAAPVADPNPLSSGTKMMFERISMLITKSAEQVAEADYAFKPTPEVRSFGQQIAHIADSNFSICAAVSGEKLPPTDIEKTKTSKADLQKGLADSIAYCTKIYAGLTDDEAKKMVTFFGRERPKLVALNMVISHDFEHYGNIVTYMRLKGMVPPSSQRPPK